MSSCNWREFASIRKPRNCRRRILLVRNLLDDPKLAKEPELWRMAANIADSRNMTSLHMECLEKALDLEYRDLPAVINLDTVREEYGKLLHRCNSLADAIVALKIEPPVRFP